MKSLWVYTLVHFLLFSFFLLFLSRDSFKGMTDKVNDAKGVFLGGYLIGLCNISAINHYTFTDS